jgi:hypothetical protein
MTARRLMLATMAIMLLLVGRTTAEQACPVAPSHATAFMGTWPLLMTEPLGGHETVRIWDDHGSVAASVQSEPSPPINATGILKDGNMLVLTTTRFENGQPIWAVISLTIEGDTMAMAQMLQPSRTIMRGSGRRQ